MTLAPDLHLIGSHPGMNIVSAGECLHVVVVGSTWEDGASVPLRRIGIHFGSTATTAKLRVF